MSSILGKIPKFTLKFPSALAKGGRTMSECPLELSFSLCDDGSCIKNKTEEQIPLQVKLPQCSSEKQEDILLVNTDALEKAEEETSEKQDNMEVTCSVSVDGQEKQEFSFTLYDFDTCEKSNKQDVEKVVVRSICEALHKTLKLPPSGSRTIKVKLAISPDGSCSSGKDPEEAKEPHDCCSANTASTYLPPPSERPLPPVPNHLGSPRVTHSPKLRSPAARAGRAHRGQARLQTRMHAADNRHQPEELSHNLADLLHRSPKVSNNRDNVPECRDRRNHYLDLAGVESPKPNNLTSSAEHHRHPPPEHTCPYRLLDRSHTCSGKPRPRECSASPLKKQPPPLYANRSPRLLPRNLIRPDDDLLNLDYDLCDLVPEARFDWEKPSHHKRSKSYDLYENTMNNPNFYSPKLKPKNWANILENQKLLSPGHQFRHRHRDREKARAMEQVASWIAREHSNSKTEATKQFVRSTVAPGSPHKQCTERHEHHHIHEHVHHHYHHLVDF